MGNPESLLIRWEKPQTQPGPCPACSPQKGHVLQAWDRGGPAEVTALLCERGLRDPGFWLRTGSTSHSLTPCPAAEAKRGPGAMMLQDFWMVRGRDMCKALDMPVPWRPGLSDEHAYWQSGLNIQGAPVGRFSYHPESHRLHQTLRTFPLL